MNQPITPQDLAQQAVRPATGNYETLPNIKLDTPGQSIFGVIEEIKEVSTQYGDRTVVTIAEQTMGRAQLWASQTQLRSGLVDGQNNLGRPARAGDTVYVEYEGQQQIDGGRQVKNFRVAIADGQQQSQARQPAPAPAPAPGPQQHTF